MLPRLTVTRFARVIPTSRTKPCIVYCENDEGEEMEFVLKTAAGGDTGIRGLVAEIMAAQIANALDLRIPEACLLEITPEFAATRAESRDRGNYEAERRLELRFEKTAARLP